MKNFNSELIAKAKSAKSSDELYEIAKANGVEITESEAKTYFAQLGAKGAVSDDELDIVAGGAGLPGCGYNVGTKVKIPACRECGSEVGVVAVNPGGAYNCVRCSRCSNLIYRSITDDCDLEKL